MTSRLLQTSLGAPDYDGIREALRNDTSTEVLAVRGLSVRADTPPLFRRDEAGTLRQAVRIKAAPGLDLALETGDGASVAAGRTSEAGTATLLVPEGAGRLTL